MASSMESAQLGHGGPLAYLDSRAPAALGHGASGTLPRHRAELGMERCDLPAAELGHCERDALGREGERREGCSGMHRRKRDAREGERVVILARDGSRGKKK